MAHKKKQRKLRKIYMEDPEARKFLKAHPEFNDQYLEQREQHYRDDRAGFSLQEPEYDDRSEKLILALDVYPEGRLRSIMRSYYANDSISELQKKLGHKNRLSTFVYITRAKKKLERFYDAYKTRRVNVGDFILIGTKTFIRGGVKRRVHLTFDPYTEEDQWVSETGEVFDSDVQAELDKCDWDVLDFDIKE